jgi:Phage tail tube protein
MAGGIVLGLAAHLYLEPGTTTGYTAGTLVSNCQDLMLKVEKNTADVTTRGNNGWRAKVAVLRDVTVTFKMIYDNNDPTVAMVLNSFLSNTAPTNQLQTAVLDPDGFGLTASMVVTSCSRNEPLEEALTLDVELTIAYDPAHPPTWTI